MSTQRANRQAGSVARQFSGFSNAASRSAVQARNEANLQNRARGRVTGHQHPNDPAERPLTQEQSGMRRATQLLQEEIDSDLYRGIFNAINGTHYIQPLRPARNSVFSHPVGTTGGVFDNLNTQHDPQRMETPRRVVTLPLPDAETLRDSPYNITAHREIGNIGDTVPQPWITAQEIRENMATATANITANLDANLGGVRVGRNTWEAQPAVFNWEELRDANIARVNVTGPNPAQDFWATNNMVEPRRGILRDTVGGTGRVEHGGAPGVETFRGFIAEDNVHAHQLGRQQGHSGQSTVLTQGVNKKLLIEALKDDYELKFDVRKHGDRMEFKVSLFNNKTKEEILSAEDFVEMDD